MTKKPSKTKSTDTGNTCSVCSKTGTGPRLPKGWKRTDVTYCDKCWKARYVLRAVTMEVLKPLGDGIGWPELREVLKASWGQATSMTNWIMGRMFAVDHPRLPDDGRLGKFEFDGKPLYAECRQAWPDFRPTSLASLMNSLQGKYRKKRWEILWTGESSLPSARYPQPYPVHNREWKPMFVPAGKDGGGDLVPAIDVPLVGGRMLLQLRQGKDWRGQVADFRKFVSGEAVKGELAVLRKRVGGNGSDHGNGVMERDEGGQKAMHRVMVKMVGWFPREARGAVAGSLLLRKDANSLLVVCRETERGLGTVRQWHWGHLRRWAAEHRRRLQMWSDDQKAEQRRPHASFESRREAACRKYRNRMESAQKELAHQIAELCRRQRVATLEYDDTDCGYFGDDGWTWSAFETVLANKLNEFGVLFNRKESSDDGDTGNDGSSEQ